VDFATAASQNGVCITQEKCQIGILFLSFSMIKDKSNKKCNVFCHDMNNIGFPRKGMLVRAKSLIRDAAVAESTVFFSSTIYCRSGKEIGTRDKPCRKD